MKGIVMYVLAFFFQNFEAYVTIDYSGGGQITKSVGVYRYIHLLERAISGIYKSNLVLDVYG